MLESSTKNDVSQVNFNEKHQIAHQLPPFRPIFHTVIIALLRKTQYKTITCHPNLMQVQHSLLEAESVTWLFAFCLICTVNVNLKRKHL